ncbi:hypothetical protein BD289DRAFT_435722 [Coniella lustricola]|uniref:Uncharacterized protein n=1 Tax=Coniella lustricola TaxID=2025994 RepID=A0A2T3A647_9PEZI|nr:hypothetical protein BD289DRAFT_435722 [Coniella lustricola]
MLLLFFGASFIWHSSTLGWLHFWGLISFISSHVYTSDCTLFVFTFLVCIMMVGRQH